MRINRNTKQRLFEVIGRIDPTFKKRKLNENRVNSKEDLVNYLKQNYPEADDMDIEAAIWWFAHDYHEGQNSPLYSIVSTSSYKPSHMINNVHDEDETVVDMYTDLENNFS